MTAPLRAFLIDDEPLALKRLGRLLEATGRVEIVGRATDPVKALGELADHDADVVFLDIQMPGLSGFQVVEQLPAGARVVFTTAYNQHAVHAFEVNAVYYLLKPIDRGRLDQALDRIAERRDRADDGRPDDILARLAKYLRTSSHLDHLASRVGGRVQLIGVDTVTHVVAKDRATYAVTAKAEFLLDTTIAELERKLDPSRFIRIHRGTMVNLEWVGELYADVGGRLVARLKDERRTDLTVSRDRVRALKERLGL